MNLYRAAEHRSHEPQYTVMLQCCPPSLSIASAHFITTRSICPDDGTIKSYRNTPPTHSHSLHCTSSHQRSSSGGPHTPTDSMRGDEDRSCWLHSCTSEEANVSPCSFKVQGTFKSTQVEIAVRTHVGNNPKVVVLLAGALAQLATASQTPRLPA